MKIVCLGDSITCNWQSPSYPEYWQEWLDREYGQREVKVINAGINGETMQDGYYRLKRDVLSHNPDLVTVMFGHNDLYYGIKPYVYEHYLGKTLAAAWAQRNNVLLVKMHEAFAGEDLDSVYTKERDYPPYGPDPVHPSKKGHRLMGRRLMDTFKSAYPHLKG